MVSAPEKVFESGVAGQRGVVGVVDFHAKGGRTCLEAFGVHEEPAEGRAVEMIGKGEAEPGFFFDLLDDGFGQRASRPASGTEAGPSLSEMGLLAIMAKAPWTLAITENPAVRGFGAKDQGFIEDEVANGRLSSCGVKSPSALRLLDQTICPSLLTKINARSRDVSVLSLRLERTKKSGFCCRMNW